VKVLRDLDYPKEIIETAIETLQHTFWKKVSQKSRCVRIYIFLKSVAKIVSQK
jgi:hypothetical protein